MVVSAIRSKLSVTAYFAPVQNTWNNLSPASKAVLLMFVPLIAVQRRRRSLPRYH